MQRLRLVLLIDAALGACVVATISVLLAHRGLAGAATGAFYAAALFVVLLWRGAAHVKFVIRTCRPHYFRALADGFWLGMLVGHAWVWGLIISEASAAGTGFEDFPHWPALAWLGAEFAAFWAGTLFGAVLALVAGAFALVNVRILRLLRVI